MAMRMAARLAALLALVLPTSSTLDDSDPDYPEYAKFLRDWRPHSEERRRLNSHSSERFQIFKSNLRKYEDLQRRDPGASYGVTMFSDLSCVLAADSNTNRGDLIYTCAAALALLLRCRHRHRLSWDPV